jgi:hypothetical protein
MVSLVSANGYTSYRTTSRFGYIHNPSDAVQISICLGARLVRLFHSTSHYKVDKTYRKGRFETIDEFANRVADDIDWRLDMHAGHDCGLCEEPIHPGEGMSSPFGSVHYDCGEHHQRKYPTEW